MNKNVDYIYGFDWLHTHYYKFHKICCCISSGWLAGCFDWCFLFSYHLRIAKIDFGKLTFLLLQWSRTKLIVQVGIFVIYSFVSKVFTSSKCDDLRAPVRSPCLFLINNSFHFYLRFLAITHDIVILVVAILWRFSRKVHVHYMELWIRGFGFA